MLVPYDGSPHSQRALALAAELARLQYGWVQVLYAYDPIPGHLSEPSYQEVYNQVVPQARELVADAVQPYRAEDLYVTTDVQEGPAAEAILLAAQVEDYDLIIMGSRGLGRLEDLLLGSVSDRVIHHGKIPVLLVR